MSQESMPFFDSAEAATKHAIHSSGRNPKDVGSALFPDKTPDAARTALLNALNENRSERLTADQHIFIANYCQRFDWLYYCAHQCSHARPEQVTPEAKAAHIQAALVETVGQMKSLIGQFEALQQPKLRAVA